MMALAQEMIGTLKTSKISYDVLYFKILKNRKNDTFSKLVHLINIGLV